MNKLRIITVVFFSLALTTLNAAVVPVPIIIPPAAYNANNGRQNL